MEQRKILLIAAILGLVGAVLILSAGTVTYGINLADASERYGYDSFSGDHPDVMWGLQISTLAGIMIGILSVGFLCLAFAVGKGQICLVSPHILTKLGVVFIFVGAFVLLGYVVMQTGIRYWDIDVFDNLEPWLKMMAHAGWLFDLAFFFLFLGLSFVYIDLGKAAGSYPVQYPTF